MVNDLSCTEKYVLCLLNVKGNINYICSDKKFTCFIISQIFELLNEGIISMDHYKVKVKRDFNCHNKYLKVLYDEIKKFGPIKIQHLVERYTTSITRKKHYIIINQVIDILESKDMLKKYEKQKIIGKTYLYAVKPDVIDNLIRDIKKVENNVCLDALLMESLVLSKYISKEEIKIIKEKMRNDLNSEILCTIEEVWSQIFRSDIISLGLSSI